MNRNLVKTFGKDLILSGNGKTLCRGRSEHRPAQDPHLNAEPFEKSIYIQVKKVFTFDLLEVGRSLLYLQSEFPGLRLM